MGWVSGIVQTLRRWKNDRLYRRLPAGEVDVKITPKGGDGPTVTRKIGNWSPGGLYVLSRELLPVETHVVLELSLGPGVEGSNLSLEGQVVRHQVHPETGEPEGMGIMFTNFTQKGLQVLRDLLLATTKGPTGD